MQMIGMMLQDRYEILEKIGSGGMSDVYKARCHKLNRLVAIKVLKAEFTSDAGFVSKFKMEAQAAAGLSHPNIVSVYDVVDEGELHYIVMELIEGITLKSYIKKKGHLDVKETLGISIQVAQGIEAAHLQHIVHRDIKPQNMLISREGKVKVADFGIARAVSSQTLNAAVVGSIHYISPEQARGGYSDGRSDIYSLGITMYEMITGRVPFEGDNTVTVALAHLEEPIVDPSVYNPQISQGLRKIILKCTEKRPENRYQNAGALIRDLRKALLNPDDPSIGREERPEEEDQKTIQIGDNELNMIHSRVKDQIENEKIDSEYRRRQKSVYAEEKEEETSKLEKMMTIFGVVAAILVVVVVIAVLISLGGVFRRGSSGENQTSISAEASGQNQKAVSMPDVKGYTQDEAEQILRELDLVMKVELSNTDEVEKGIVIDQKVKPGDVISRFSDVVVVVSDGTDKIDLASIGITDMTLETAVRLLEAKGLKAVVLEEHSDTVEKGSIIKYTPEDKAPAGTTVTLYVSTGPVMEVIPAPDIRNKTEEEAFQIITEAGLIPGEVTTGHSMDVPAGSVISQEIAPGTDIEKGATFDFMVSKGPDEPETKFLASLEASYPLMISFGPGGTGDNIDVMVRLKQIVNGKEVYTTLMEPKNYSADTTLELRFTNIPGATGVLTGEVEVVDITNEVILTSYNVNFVEVEVR